MGGQYCRAIAAGNPFTEQTRTLEYLQQDHAARHSIVALPTSGDRTGMQLRGSCGGSYILVGKYDGPTVSYDVNVPIFHGPTWPDRCPPT